jgi:putative transposase
VYRVVKQLDPALLILAHAGTKAYRTTFDLLYRREAAHANAIWQADHTLLDLWVFRENTPPARPWLTVIMDDYSRAIAGFGVSFRAPSALQTALVLRQAIWRKAMPQWQVCGIPGTFYTDHSSDFTSHHLEQVSADLTMALVFSEAGMPRGRGRIERFFRTINQMLLCGLPGYTPAGPPAGQSLLTLAAFEAQLQQFILDQYHQQPHSETGVAPHARWAAGGFLPRLPESPRTARSLIAERGAKSQGTPRWDSFPGLAVFGPHAGRLCGRTRHHSVRPAGYGRDPGLSPEPVSLSGHLPRTGRRNHCSTGDHPGS